mmetsp:Transcript_80945/g.160914  ORF Transcript_80945/g.160914 Transcript_80945/m.160914 type:complete len:229 (+) Transcript_80945:244-930(+)
MGCAGLSSRLLGSAIPAWGSLLRSSRRASPMARSSSSSSTSRSPPRRASPPPPFARCASSMDSTRRCPTHNGPSPAPTRSHWMRRHGFCVSIRPTASSRPPPVRGKRTASSPTWRRGPRRWLRPTRSYACSLPLTERGRPQIRLLSANGSNGRGSCAVHSECWDTGRQQVSTYQMSADVLFALGGYTFTSRCNPQADDVWWSHHSDLRFMCYCERWHSLSPTVRTLPC